MSETPYFISLEEAINIAQSTPIKVETEFVSLDEAHGRILGSDLPSKVNDPPFDNSAMDGFAVRHKDSKEAPTTLAVVATTQAAASQGTSVTSTKSGFDFSALAGQDIYISARFENDSSSSTSGDDFNSRVISSFSI